MRPAVISWALTTVALAAPRTFAVDYPGGWLPTPPKQQCVDICVNSKAAPTCLTGDPKCLAKKQRPGDYDYLLLEQLFVPQFCRDLLNGVDSTISHQNVNAYPAGIACQPHVVKSELTIHGLWPNYDDGYAGCCNVTDALANKPFHAAEFARNQKKLLKRMSREWVDATQKDEHDSLCEIYNHEFQKHGICYNAFGDDWEKAAVNYFEATLNVAARVDRATKEINKWAKKKPGDKKTTTTVAAVQALYPAKVQLLCANPSGAAPATQLSAIRSCWHKPPVSNATARFAPRDCAAPTKGGAFAPCDATAAITLDAYVPPQPVQ